VNVAQLARSLVLLMGFTLLTACGGGGGGGGNAAAQGSNADSGCTGSCATTTPANLTVADVETILSQAVQEATARGVNATIAVTDRVGNVLAIFQMNGSAATFTISSGLVDGVSGLENLAILPTDLAAIAKAVTGSYLASEGNAFTTRTASQIVQEHFNPHETGQPGGPLFGVQFSQLPCGDMVSGGAGIGVGPQRSPLGLSADPGGMPLYKNGHPVGGIGVIADALYSLDRDVQDQDNDVDELIAVAGQFGFAPPVDRQADRITADGRTFRYADVDSDDLLSNPATAPTYASIDGVLGNLIDDSSVTGIAQNYFIAAGGILAGSTFGMPGSGIEPADTIDNTLYPGLDAFLLTDGAGTNRYPPTAGTAIAGNELSAAEVTQLMRSALDVANRARAQIRRPLDSQARVTISIVDTEGNILAIARTRDAPIFGIDVSLQKARTATFFSSTDAGTTLSAEADVTYLNPNGTASTVTVDFSDDYVGSIASDMGVRAFLGDNGALANGIAFADRSGGNLSRPFYPDGNDLEALPNNGPFSKPFVTDTATNEWSPFSDGLQLDLVLNQLVAHLAAGANNTSCAGTTRLANGIQIFPGSVPIYRNGLLVGGIGVSGDGVDQDDMISFLGTYNASIALGGDGIGDAAMIGNAPTNIRADNVTPVDYPGQALRYIQCPQNPFIGSSDNNVCAGK